MTRERLSELFEIHEDEFLKFDRVDPKRSSRPDINAFLLLNELLPGTSDIVSGASHDVFYLDVDLDGLAAVASDDQIVELIRSGVHLEEEYDSLAMFA